MLQQGASEEKGENARMVSLACLQLCGVVALTRNIRAFVPTQQAAFVGAMAIADLVKSTLGPKGMVRASVLFTPVSRYCLLVPSIPFWTS